MRELAQDLALALDPTVVLKRAGVTPAPWQRRALLSPSPRLLLLASRQAGKSTTAAALALHTALVRQEATVLLIAPSQRQSQELANRVRRFAQVLGLELQAESALRLELRGGSRVIALPAKEGTIRGYSAHLVVLDEAAWIPDDLYAAVRPMLAATRGRLVAISTPFGTRGWFWREWVEGEGWERVMVTAYDVPHLDPAFLEEERRALGEWRFRQEYLCEFLSSGGAIPEEDVERATRLPGPEEPREGRRYVAGLDLARVHDWTALAIVDATEPEAMRLVRLERWRAEWEETVERVLSLVRPYAPRLLVDATGVGDPVYDRLRRAYPNVYPYRFSHATKPPLVTELRLALAEGRLLLYPDPALLGELRALEARQTTYGVSYEAPSGAHDDTVMALALAVWAARHAAPTGGPYRVKGRW